MEERELGGFEKAGMRWVKKAMEEEGPKGI